MRYHCCDPRRLEVLRRSGSDNAINFVEVLDRAAPPGVARQRTLFLRLLRDGFTLSPENLRIDGGERIARVGIAWCAPADALPAEAEAGLANGLDDPARTLVIRTDGEGDFSRYTLALVANSGDDQPPAGFDPLLSRIEFSFKVECPSDFDCAQSLPCPTEVAAAPDIDYLARDYPGFRRLMLDRMDLLVPGWRERSAADLGVTLVELLAYAADNLSYRQDAVANEAYLSTARRRSSVRRHARLVDYHLHDGCNARTWVQVRLAEGSGDLVLAGGTRLLTRVPGIGAVIEPGSRDARQAMAAAPVVFETAHTVTLHADRNELLFYTWGDAGCCLPRGATSATLRGRPPLAVGDVLVFVETRSPTTLSEHDADRGHRWAVRLTGVDDTAIDPSGGLFEEPAVDEPREVTRIEWAPADALPFPLCLGVESHPELVFAVARGNIVLADHGHTLPDEALPEVPDAVRRYAPGASQADRCGTRERVPVPVRYRPWLASQPVTQGFALADLLAATRDDTPAPLWPASQLLPLDPRHALPRIALLEDDPQLPPWSPRHDLLGSDAGAPHFVVETEHDGRTRLRFGDDRNGKRPNPGTRLRARYRVGNGVSGNIGADALAHLVFDPALYADGPDPPPDPTAIEAIGNPMPAAGGTAPEDVEAARRDAPHAFRTQERAVTADDYAAVSERSPEVGRAAATFRWTGSWYSVFVSADRPGGAAVDAPFRSQLRRHLERYRMAGYDVAVDAPRMVPLDLALHVCVKPGYFRSDVLAAVERALSARLHPDGSLGLFHPDRFSFGDPVYLSSVVATAQAVAGVASVRVDRFRRLVNGSAASLEEGVIRLDRLEIAQLANNPNFRERGKLSLSAGGGQ
ncbi:putative baseplate assembly protein [Luteimonas viscosa]|uniref:Putative baseplate assembly protein n=1 Tax=Luteimonas viscosa TaxID=1132694 RepID=A0A5D4XGP1_9GAMM|nr:putative baseplate assembly protein [Luteimonas viscosa]TYT23816.1 putative baseplate assembly protein [Luteimonas viscosa]